MLHFPDNIDDCDHDDDDDDGGEATGHICGDSVFSWVVHSVVTLFLLSFQSIFGVSMNFVAHQIQKTVKILLRLFSYFTEVIVHAHGFACVH